MTVKKKYTVGDTVWIYGVGALKNTLTKGKVIKTIDLSDVGYADPIHYVIEIPTHIDPLLEIRNWATISQDAKGPVGAFRNLGEMVSTIKKARTAGFSYATSEEDPDDPTPEQIHAALEKSQQGSVYQPLVLKDTTPIRRPRPRKKK